MKYFIAILILCSAFCFGQGLGAIDSGRAIDWTHAGLSSTLGSGETTVNPWTPPTGRTQCVTAACNTVTANAGSSTPAQINAAIASASAQTYILLPCGQYTINSNLTFLGSANFLTLRGGGPMCTYLNFSGTNTSIVTSVCCNSAQNGSLSLSSYAVGTTSITITGATCGTGCGQLAAGNVLFLIQCDQGAQSGSFPPYGGFASTCDGVYTDPYPSGQSAVWQCGRDIGVCNQNDFSIKGNVNTQNAATGGCAANCVTLQQAAITITSFTGTTGTLTFTNSGTNLLAASMDVTLSGFSGGNTALNGQNAHILAAGLSSTTFEAVVTGSGFSSGGGTATPVANFVTGTNWNNVPILINGVRFVISSVQSTTVLTLTTAPGTQTNSPYLFNQSIHAYLQENKIITSVTPLGGGSYTINFTPGLYSADWSSSRFAIAWWSNKSDMSLGIGIEDMTLHLVPSGNNKAGFGGTCDSWFKGNRIIAGTVNAAFSINRGCHDLEANNYFVGSDPDALISNISEMITIGDATTSGGFSDNLDLNNIITDTLCHWGEGNNSGNVWGYPACYNAQQPDYQTVIEDHFSGQMFDVTEGGFFGRYQVDITHGTPNLCLLSRSVVSGDDPPFYTQNPGSMQFPAYARFCNVLANAFGGNRTTAYQGTSFSQGDVYAIQNNSDNAGNTDPLNSTGLYRRGNCDTFTGTCKFDPTEVPGTLTGNAAPYSQTDLGADHGIPCSFVLTGHTTRPCVPTTPGVGGSGLSWWKVCTSWSSFPTSCSGFTIQPFPIAGPELSGGPYVNGHGYDPPAAVAFRNLPIDTSFQHAFRVTASGNCSGATCSISGAGPASAPYSPGTVLTVSLTAIGGNLSAEHIMGGFQLAAPGTNCLPPNTSISYTGRADNEILITSSSTTAIVYANSNSTSANACASTSVGTGTSVTMSGGTATFSGTFTTTGLAANSIIGVTGCTGITTYNDIPWTIVTVNGTTITATSSRAGVTGLGSGSSCTLFANPLLFPDMRQFDESIFSLDSIITIFSNGSVGNGTVIKNGAIIK